MSEISPILVLPTKKTNKISDMTKVAIKNVNITSFGGIYHIMDVFSKLGFEKLTESVLGKRGSSGKAFCYGSIFVVFHTSPLVWVGDFMIMQELSPQEIPISMDKSPKCHFNI